MNHAFCNPACSEQSASYSDLSGHIPCSASSLNPFAAVAGHPWGAPLLSVPKLPSICTRALTPACAGPLSNLIRSSSGRPPLSPAARPAPPKHYTGVRRGSGNLASLPRQRSCESPVDSLRPLSFTISRHLSSSEILLPPRGGAVSQCTSELAVCSFRRQSSTEYAAQLQAQDDAAFDVAFAASQSPFSGLPPASCAY